MLESQVFGIFLFKMDDCVICNANYYSMTVILLYLVSMHNVGADFFENRIFHSILDLQCKC